MTRFNFSVLTVAVMGVACGGAPLSGGTSWTLKTTETNTQTSYWLRQGGNPVESSGPLGSSTSCILAETSSGTANSTSVAETFTVNTALGDTEMYHPLVPNSDDFSSSLATVLQRRTRGAASVESTVMAYDPDSVVGNTTTTTFADEAIETNASFHGLAVDEYVVEFPLGNIWNDPEDSSGNVTLLTRYEPDLGDIWASENGNTVYIASVKEQISFSGVVKKATKVEAFEVGGLQVDGGDIIEQCFAVGKDQVQSTNPDIGLSSTDQLFLDRNCFGAFEHVKSGTEWWYGPILVKEVSSVTSVEITNYGYEWYELDETGLNCTRVISQTYDSPNAVQFVEYELITTERESVISKWVEQGTNGTLGRSLVYFN